LNIFIKGSFKRDTARVHDATLLIALQEKITQIETAKNIQHITSMKLLRGYRTHYRIQVRTQEESFRIGAVIRGNSIWLVRFLSRKKDGDVVELGFVTSGLSKSFLPTVDLFLNEKLKPVQTLLKSTPAL